MHANKANIEVDRIRSRPRFKVKTNLSRLEFLERFRKRLHRHPDIFYGYVGEETSLIGCHRNKDKPWSPQLRVMVEWDEEENVTMIRGIFGPKPDVWTFFAFLYILGFTILFLELMFFFSSLIVHLDPIWYLPLPIGIGILLFTYFAAKTGQKFAKDDMRKLRRFMEYVLRKEKIIHD